MCIRDSAHIRHHGYRHLKPRVVARPLAPHLRVRAPPRRRKSHPLSIAPSHHLPLLVHGDQFKYYLFLQLAPHRARVSISIARPSRSQPRPRLARVPPPQPFCRPARPYAALARAFVQRAIDDERHRDVLAQVRRDVSPRASVRPFAPRGRRADVASSARARRASRARRGARRHRRARRKRRRASSRRPAARSAATTRRAGRSSAAFHRARDATKSATGRRDARPGRRVRVRAVRVRDLPGARATRGEAAAD